jgi:GxxExxY protein
MTLIDKELTYALKGSYFDVQNQVGFGLPEEAYQEGLTKAFLARGIPARPHPHLRLSYKDRVVVELVPDFIVGERVVVELKSLRDDFAREHYVQLFSYLKAARIRLGFLVNFGRERVYDERRVFDEKPMAIEEHWDAAKGRVEGSERASMAAARQALLTVGKRYGLGYGEGTYQRLFAAVLEDEGHSLDLEPRAEPYYNNQLLSAVSVDCLLVDEKIPCVVMALKDGLSRFDLARCESYVRNIGLRYGVAANFGKDKLELAAVATH